MAILKYNLLLRHQKDYTETINDLFSSIKIEDNKKFQDIGTCFKLSTLYYFYIILVFYYTTKNIKYNSQ